MTQAMTIFKDGSGEYPRYWANITVQQDSEGKPGKKKAKYESAAISVSLSRKAAKFFNNVCEDTKNDDVKRAFVRADDFWLKAVKGKEENFIVLFINKLSEVKKSSDDEEEDEE